jgi:hypothetical protein
MAEIQAGHMVDFRSQMKRRLVLRAQIVWLSLSLCGAAYSSVIPVGPEAFPAGAALLDFATLSTGTEVNGLTVNGVQFSYTVGGSPLNGAVQIDGGPGTTNNITPPNIVSVGDDTGILGLLLPAPVTLFGYGYAILSVDTIANAATINIFMGTSNLGTLSYTGVPDPTFTGGFAGIQSTIPFDRVELTFNSTAAPAFAVDNIRFAIIPEPSTISLTVVAFALGLWRRRP